MLFFRLWLIGVILGGGWAFLSYVFTRDRRYLRSGRRILISAAIFASVLVGLRLLQRTFA